MKKLLFITVLILIVIESSEDTDVSEWLGHIEQLIHKQTTSTLKRPNFEEFTTELTMLTNSLSSIERHYLTDTLNGYSQANVFKVTYCDNNTLLTHYALTTDTFEQTCNVLNKYIK